MVTIKSNDNFGYKGNVTIKLVHNNKVYKVIKSHNNGYLPLFNFLINCLSGTFYESSRPQWLRLFDLGDDDWDEASDIPTKEVSRTVFSEGSARADLDNGKAILTFTVSCFYLTKDKNITHLALYSNDNVDDRTKPSAVVKLETPLSTNAIGNDNVVILWSLSFDNIQEQE